jgi:hypothetical protein
MPRVRYLTVDAGPAGVRHPGHVVDVGAEEAEALVRGHHAEYIDPPARRVLENTSASPAENAMQPPSIPRPPRGAK